MTIKELVQTAVANELVDKTDDELCEMASLINTLILPDEHRMVIPALIREVFLRLKENRILIETLKKQTRTERTGRNDE